MSAPTPPRPTFNPAIIPDLRIMSAEEAASGYISACYLGYPHTGKTRWSCTWPGAVVIHFDPGAPSTAMRAGVPVLPVVSWKQFEQRVVPAILDRRIDTLVHQDPRFTNYDVQTLVFDSGTYAAQMLEDELGIRGNLGMKGTDSDAPRYTGFKVQFRQRFQSLVAVTKRPLGQGYNVICNFHLSEKREGADAKVIGHALAVVGELKAQVAGWFDLVVRCHRRPVLKQEPGKGVVKDAFGDFYITTTPTDEGGTLVINDRVWGRPGYPNRLPAEMPGDYPSLMAAWKGEAK